MIDLEMIDLEQMTLLQMSSGSVATSEELLEARTALGAEQQREAALSLFARRMSHDMSNLVTVVRTYSELLLADLPAGSTANADVQEIHSAADAMIDYMHRITRFAKVSGSKAGALQFDEAVADAVVNSCHRGRVQTELASHALVEVDAIWLAEGVHELLTNAHEASTTEVRVRTWHEQLPEPVIDAGVPIEAGSWVVLEVADDGPGFDSDVLLNAADPFVTTKNALRGAGFGLTLARTTAWHTGGQLVIDSPPHTRGSRVRMWLPALLAHRSAP